MTNVDDGIPQAARMTVDPKTNMGPGRFRKCAATAPLGEPASVPANQANPASGQSFYPTNYGVNAGTWFSHIALEPDPACRNTTGAPAPLASPKLSW